MKYDIEIYLNTHMGIKFSEDNYTYYIWTSTFTMNISIISRPGVNRENIIEGLFFRVLSWYKGLYAFIFFPRNSIPQCLLVDVTYKAFG